MREENIQRLKFFKAGINDPNYLIYKNLFKDLENAISKYATGKVLDIGCGNKPYESLFTNITKYEGCDIVQSSDKKVDIVCPATEIAAENEQYETVFSSQVLEHVQDHLKMLQEANRVLKKGGTIILSAPMCWEHHEVPYDYFRFTKYGMQYIFEKAGFSVIEIKSNGGKWAFLGQMTQNIILSSTQNKKNILRKIFRVFHLAFVKLIINAFYSLLERIDRDEEFITINFVVVAKKI